MNKRITKILFIHHATGWSGAAINMVNIINGLDKTKYSIEVLLLRDSIVSKMLIEKGIRYTVAKSVFYKKYYKYFLHSDAGLEKWYRFDTFIKHIISWLLSRFVFAPNEIKRHDFDIAHLNSSVLTDWLAPCKTKNKVVIHIQEPFSNGYFGIRHNFLTSQMRKYSDCIIAISKDNAKRINIPEKTKVVYNFVEESQFLEKENYKPQYGNVLYVGGSEIIKGYFTIVDALDYLDHDIRIKFCGNYSTVDNQKNLVGSFKNIIRGMFPVHKKLKSSINKIISHPNAIFIGFINNTSQYIQESEFLISPFSKPHFSRPVFEAFLNKRCVIGTDVIGMDEIIDNNINGLIVEKDNPKMLAQAINLLHKNQQNRFEMAENGYLKAKKLFSISNVKQIEKIYDDVLNSSN